MSKSKKKNLILIGDIPDTATEVDMRGVFSQYGEIKKIYFHRFSLFGKDSGASEAEADTMGNYCVVNFARKMSVEKCIYSTVMFKGRQLLLLKVKKDEIHYILKVKKKKTLQDHIKEQMAEDKGIKEEGESETEESLEDLKDPIDIFLKELTQHIYIAFKLKQDKAVRALIENYYNKLKMEGGYVWKETNVKDIVGALSIDVRAILT